MSYRDAILWTRLPEGFTQEELHGSTVSFGDLGLSGVLHVRPLPENWFELSIVHESGGDPVKQTTLHQTSDRLFQIERLSNRGQAAFHLSFYIPSSDHLSNTRAAELPHCDPTDEL
jgi:hypothetical protein